MMNLAVSTVTSTAARRSQQCLGRTLFKVNVAANTTRSHYSYASTGQYEAANNAMLEKIWKNRDFSQRGFTVGIGGPVGSGKTALTLKLLQTWQQMDLPEGVDLQLGVVTNDIFTQEDAEFLTKNNALPADRIMAVETGGCPHAAIREDVSSNLTALEQLSAASKSSSSGGSTNFPLLICESGGDNLAANFSRELADLTLYVIDVAGGDKVPRKGGPGITQSDLLIINKIDLAEAVGADLSVMERDANRMRASNPKDESKFGPTVFCSVRDNVKVPEVSDFVLSMYEKATGVKLQQPHSHDHTH